MNIAAAALPAVTNIAGTALGGMFGEKGLKNAQGQYNQYAGQARNTLEEYLKSSQGFLSPYNQMGMGKIGQLNEATGQQIPSTLATPFSMQNFMNDPGYQFMLEQGQKSINRGAAARGQYFSPATMKGLSDYSQGMAGQEYGNAFNRYMNYNQGLFNQNLAGQGQNVNQLLQMMGLGQNAAAQMGQWGMGTGGGIADILMGQGGMNANIANALMQNRANMYGGILSQVGSMGSLGGGGGMMSGVSSGIPGGIGGGGAFNLPPLPMP